MMGSNRNSPTPDPDEAEGVFRKPANDAASRKYRRRSSASPSASPESPKQDLCSSPTFLKEDQSRKHNTRGDRLSGRGDYEYDSESRRYSSKGSQVYNRSNDHSRGGKYVDEEDRSYSRLSSRSSRESKGGAYPDYKERGGNHTQSRDYYHYKDKYSRDRSDVAQRSGRDKYDDRDRRGRDRECRDEKRDYGRSSRDYRSDRITSCEESNRNQDDTVSRRENNRQKEADKNVNKAEHRSKYLNDEYKKHDAEYCKESLERFPDGAPPNRNDETAVKRPKLFDSNFPAIGSKQGQDLLGRDTPAQAAVNIRESAGSLDAAKVAAMKAAELVNKNLVGTGGMTADQKKKLLWGNKKNTVTEETSHRWDASIFPDRERQEKFNKLMGVKGDAKLVQNPSSDPVQTEKQRELQLDLEKQYTAGLRRRDGRTVGLGL